MIDHLIGLLARYDSLALRPPAVAGGELARLRAQAAVVRALHTWCLQGIVPRLQEPMLVGALRAAPGADTHALTTWAEAFARQIDGGLRLDTMPGAMQALAWRVRVKLNDANPWRARLPTDPWDAGWALSTPAALRQLQTAWMPRRPTLVLADAADQDALLLALNALWQRQGSFLHPVRWLWVGGGADLPTVAEQPLARFQLAAAGFAG